MGSKPRITEPPRWLMEEEWPEGSREYKAKIAWSMRLDDKTIAQMMEVLGLSRRMVSDLLVHPSYEQVREVKRRSARPCESCGRPTSESKGSKRRARLCGDCAASQPHSVERAQKISASLVKGPMPKRQMLASLRRAAGGKETLTNAEYKASGLKPSAELFEKVFGNWNRAIEAAGLRPNKTTRVYVKQFSRQDCVVAVAKVMKRLQLIPTGKQYNSERDPDMPSLGTVRSNGKWVEILVEANDYALEKGWIKP